MNFYFRKLKDKVLNKISLILFILIPLATYSQEYNIEFYCVGFMSDYMGRRIEKGTGAYENSVDDFFYQSRIYDVYRLDTLIKINNIHNEKINYEIVQRERQANCSNCEEFYDLNSKELCEKINRFYNFKKDKLNSNKTIERYTGTLKTNKILSANTRNKLSFTAGAFYRYGNLDTTGYYFEFGNSVEKLKVIRNLLKEYNCQITKETNNQVEGLYIAPIVVKFYFIPSKEIKALLDFELDMKIQLKKRTPTKL